MSIQTILERAKELRDRLNAAIPILERALREENRNKMFREPGETIWPKNGIHGDEDWDKHEFNNKP